MVETGFDVASGNVGTRLLANFKHLLNYGGEQMLPHRSSPGFLCLFALVFAKSEILDYCQLLHENRQQISIAEPFSGQHKHEGKVP